MSRIKEIVIQVQQALAIFAVVYLLMDSMERSAAVNDERVAQYRAVCRESRIEETGGIYHEEK